MSDFFSKAIQIPRFQLILLLLVFFIVASFHLSFFQSFYLLLTCTCLTVTADLAFKAIKKRQLQIPYSAIITGLIIGLIIDTQASFFQIIVICASAMLIKNFLRFDRHIFNPAASGLLLGWAIFGLSPSWWSATLYNSREFTLPNLLILLSVLALAFVSCIKIKRYLTVTTYLAALIFLSWVFSLSTSFSSLLNVLISPGNLFFAIVMVAEPMTTPFTKNRQVLFGLVVASFQILMVIGIQSNLITLSNIPDLSLVALLIANLLFFKFR